MPAVVPKIGLTPRTGIRSDNDSAVLLRNLSPRDVIGELPLDIAEKIASILPRKFVDIFGALQKLYIAEKIAAIRVRKFVDIFGASQEEYSRFVKDGYRVPVAQGISAELHALAPPFPFLVYIEPETVGLLVATLRIFHFAESDRFRSPVMIFHAPQHSRGLATDCGCPHLLCKKRIHGKLVNARMLLSFSDDFELKAA